MNIGITSNNPQWSLPFLQTILPKRAWSVPIFHKSRWVHPFQLLVNHPDKIQKLRLSLTCQRLHACNSLPHSSSFSNARSCLQADRHRHRRFHIRVSWCSNILYRDDSGHLRVFVKRHWNLNLHFVLTYVRINSSGVHCALYVSDGAMCVKALVPSNPTHQNVVNGNWYMHMLQFFPNKRMWDCFTLFTLFQESFCVKKYFISARCINWGSYLNRTHEFSTYSSQAIISDVTLTCDA